MHGNLSTDSDWAICSTGKLVSDEPATAVPVATSGKLSSDDEDWFSEMAQALLTKPGLELGLYTGFDESLCYRYSKGATKPSAYFLRRLLRSKEGGPFLRFLMHGCEAPHWTALMRAERIVAQEDQIDRS